MARKINDEGLALIKKFESLRLEAYLCPAGVWTIGYGHTDNVYEGDIITEDDADYFLDQDISRFEKDVEFLVTSEINDNQFSALVSFAFNVGSDIDMDLIPEGLGDSTLLKKVNDGDFEGASDEFPKWNKVRKNGVMTISKGLIRRRKAEQELFNAG